ncbi:MAG: hypothetical protein AAF517_15835 [Planctomycetota bacterium]
MRRRLFDSLVLLSSRCAILVLASLAVSCKSVDGTRGLPPFVEYYDSPSSDAEWRDHREGSELVIRPLFLGFEHDAHPLDLGDAAATRKESGADDADHSASRFRFLFPLGDFMSSEKRSKHRFLPIYYHNRRTKLTGGEDSSTMIFPLFFWGSDPEEGGYFAFFPFGGQLKGLFGIDQATFVLFPFYLKALRDERTSTHLLWPFVNYVEGYGWSGGRFWPFYGSYAWDRLDGTPRSRRRFILWPFYIRNRENLQVDPTEIVFSFPFYGYRENRRSLTRSYLWPLHVYHYDKKKKRSLHGGYFFPYRFTEGQRDYWPIYGTKSTVEEGEGPEGSEGFSGRRRYRQFFLWPIQRYDWADDQLAETERFWIVPFYWRVSRFDKRTLEVTSRWQLWPFMRYRSAGSHDRSFDFLAPMWWDRESLDRYWGRIFALFRYRAEETRSAWELLYGTLYWENGEEKTLFSVLGGLLELGKKDDDWIVRLLYVPWW